MQIRSFVFNELEPNEKAVFVRARPLCCPEMGAGDAGHIQIKLVKAVGTKKMKKARPPLVPNASANQRNSDGDGNEVFGLTLNETIDLVTQSLQVFPNSKPIHPTLLRGLLVQQYHRSQSKDVTATTGKDKWVFSIIANKKDAQGNFVGSPTEYTSVGETPNEAGVGALAQVQDALMTAYAFERKARTTGSACYSIASSRR